MQGTNVVELRQRIERCFDAVEGGEVVRVCRNGKPIAEIVPIPESDRSWKRDVPRLTIEGLSPSRGILKERAEKEDMKMATYPSTNQGSYTYEDYKGFPDDFRCEIIDGQVYDMTPAPSPGHQQVVGKIYRLVGNYIEGKGHGCHFFVAPTDVVLAGDQVVQPDVFLVCDETKIRDKAIFGAPDVVFEVLSAATGKKDRNKKMKLYRKFGVLEYFLVDPENELVDKYAFSQGRIGVVDSYEGDEVFSVDAIGLELAAKDLFV